MSINDRYNNQIGNDIGGTYTTSGTGTMSDNIIQLGSPINSGGYVLGTYTTPSLGWGPSMTFNDGIVVKGDSQFDGDIKIKGKNLNDTLESIEERLAILHPNPELEEKWENLRGLRKMYMDLEKEIIEQEKMWSILKK